MKIWLTKLTAIDAITGEMKTYVGERVYGLTMEMAQQWCNEHKPYLKVTGRLSMEAGFKENGEIDWNNATDYDNDLN